MRGAVVTDCWRLFLVLRQFGHSCHSRLALVGLLDPDLFQANSGQAGKEATSRLVGGASFIRFSCGHGRHGKGRLHTCTVEVGSCVGASILLI